MHLKNSPIYTDEDNGIVLLNEKISEIISQYPTAELLVAGELNARIASFQGFIPFDVLDFIFGETDYPLLLTGNLKMRLPTVLVGHF